MHSFKFPEVRTLIVDHCLMRFVAGITVSVKKQKELISSLQVCTWNTQIIPQQIVHSLYLIHSIILLFKHQLYGLQLHYFYILICCHTSLAIDSCTLHFQTIATINKLIYELACIVPSMLYAVCSIQYLAIGMVCYKNVCPTIALSLATPLFLSKLSP